MEICYSCFQQTPGKQGPCPHCGYDPARDAGKYPLALRPGSILNGRYVVGRTLGQGGFGITYVARDEHTGQKVAIKEYFPETMATRTGSHQVMPHSGEREEHFQYGLQCFLSEARTMAQFIGSEGIVQVYSYFEENGTAYFAMEYVQGSSFQEHIKARGGRISWEEAKRILFPVMDALSLVHEKGIIHRDIAPDNIYITNDGKIKLLDFGAARYSLGDKSRSLDVVLKHGYAPKEQYTRRGRQGPYTDVYALAATFYYCLTGHLPPEAIDRIDEDELMLPSSMGVKLPAGAEDAIEKGLAFQAADRFQTMAEFRRALAEEASRMEEPPEPSVEAVRPAPPVEEGPSQKAEQPPVFPEPVASPLRKAPKKGKGLLIGGAAAAVLVLAGILSFLIPGKEAPAPKPEPLQPSPQAEASQEEPVTFENVTLDILAGEYTADSQERWDAFVSDFQQDNPHIQLNVRVVNWADIYAVIETSIAAGEAPDLLNIDLFEKYQADGLLLPAQQWVSPETYDKFYPVLLDQSRAEGTVWAVPYLAVSRALFYNADILEPILEQAGMGIPSTWGELVEVCSLIQEKNPNVVPWGVDMTTDDGFACFAYYTWGNGGGFVNTQGDWNLNSAANIEAVEFIVGMVRAGLTNSNPELETRYALQDLFLQGHVAMMIAPNYLADQCRADGSISFGIAPIPANDGKDSATVTAMDRLMCFDNGYTQAELDAIRTLVDAFYEDQTHAQWVSMEGYLPVTTGAMEQYAQQDAAMAPWKDILPASRFYPTHKGEWAEVRKGVIEVLQWALTYADPKNQLDNLQKQVAS